MQAHDLIMHKNQDMRLCITNLVSNMTPLDDVEAEHIQETLTWIQSGAPLFRIKKPDVPKMHLATYFVIFDKTASKILLGDHKKSGLWLPPGGHVDVDEHPRDTAVRECREELNMDPEFMWDDPQFLTITTTVGPTAGHTDISFWYIVSGMEGTDYIFDKGEFLEMRWFAFDEIPYPRTDIHMQRFALKLKSSA